VADEIFYRLPEQTSTALEPDESARKARQGGLDLGQASIVPAMPRRLDPGALSASGLALASTFCDVLQWPYVGK